MYDDPEGNFAITLITLLIGGLIAGFIVGVCTVLGVGVGAAALGEATATLFTSTGLTLSLNSALGIGSGVSFATGI